MLSIQANEHLFSINNIPIIGLDLGMEPDTHEFKGLGHTKKGRHTFRGGGVSYTDSSNEAQWKHTDLEMQQRLITVSLLNNNRSHKVLSPNASCLGE